MRYTQITHTRVDAYAHSMRRKQRKPTLITRQDVYTTNVYGNIIACLSLFQKMCIIIKCHHSC